MIKEPQRPRPAHLAFLEHYETEFHSLGVEELLFSFLLVYTAYYAVKDVLDIFFFLGAFRRVPFPVSTKELEEGVNAIQVDEASAVNGR